MKKVKKDKPMIFALVLDESGSMTSLQDTVISGLNEYIQDRVKDSPDSLMYITKFSSVAVPLSTGTKIKDLPEFSKENYFPSGMTALHDAIGSTINMIDKKVKGNRVTFVIVTDGQENSSKEFKQPDIKKLIQDREGKDWVFMYLAANQDAWTAAQSIGMKGVGNTITYSATPGSLKRAAKVCSVATSNYVADSSADTLTLCSGTGIGITTEDGSVDVQDT